MIQTRFTTSHSTFASRFTACAVLPLLVGGCASTPDERTTEINRNGEILSSPWSTNDCAAAYGPHEVTPITTLGLHGEPGIAGVAFSTPPDGLAASTPTTAIPLTGAHSRSNTLIGLYGEIAGSTPDAGAQLDGQSNLTQVSFATEGSCIDPDIDRTGTTMVFASTMHRATSDIYIKSVNGKTCTQLTADPADDVMPCFSPDSQTVAFASKRSGNWDIFTLGVSGGRPIQITSDSDPELHPTWSPDGRTIAYCKFGSQSSRWEIWTVDVANPSAPRFLEYGVFPRWNPDPVHNKILFQRAKQRGSREYSVWTIDVINGQAMNPTEIVSASNAALINPAWSTDGSRIVFVSVMDPENDPGTPPTQSDLWVVNLDGTDRTNLTNGQFANFQPVWASDGSVYFVSNRSGVDNIWAVSTAHAGPAPHVDAHMAATPAPTPAPTTPVPQDHTNVTSADSVNYSTETPH